MFSEPEYRPRVSSARYTARGAVRRGRACFPRSFKKSSRTPATPAWADAPPPFSANEFVDDGRRFFGSVSHGLADVVQEAVRRWGLPNAYILGQEASGAFVGGLRYGEGKMYTRNAGNRQIFWQGRSALMPALTATEQ